MIMCTSRYGHEMHFFASIYIDMYFFYIIYITVTPETSKKLREKLLEKVDISPKKIPSLTPTAQRSATPYHNHSIYLNDEEIDTTTWSMNL